MTTRPYTYGIGISDDGAYLFTYGLSHDYENVYVTRYDYDGSIPSFLPLPYDTEVKITVDTTDATEEERDDMIPYLMYPMSDFPDEININTVGNEVEIPALPRNVYFTPATQSLARPFPFSTRISCRGSGVVANSLRPFDAIMPSKTSNVDAILAKATNAALLLEPSGLKSVDLSTLYHFIENDIEPSKKDLYLSSYKLDKFRGYGHTEEGFLYAMPLKDGNVMETFKEPAVCASDVEEVDIRWDEVGAYPEPTSKIIDGSIEFKKSSENRMTTFFSMYYSTYTLEELRVLAFQTVYVSSISSGIQNEYAEVHGSSREGGGR